MKCIRVLFLDDRNREHLQDLPAILMADPNVYVDATASIPEAAYRRGKYDIALIHASYLGVNDIRHWNKETGYRLILFSGGFDEKTLKGGNGFLRVQDKYLTQEVQKFIGVVQKKEESKSDD